MGSSTSSVGARTHASLRWARVVLAGIAFTLAAVLALGFGPRIALAEHIVPDLDRTGSITVRMFDPDTQKPVSGGTLTMFKVGDIAEDDGDFSFVLGADFAGSKESLANLDDSDLPGRLAAYAQERGLSGVTRTVNNDGTVAFANLELGLYLLVQSDPASGYYAVNPFVVSVPVEDAEAGGYVYSVDATPKMELRSRAPEEPDKPGDMPQTGDTFNPVLVAGIAAAGVALIAVGVVLRRFLTPYKR